MNAALSSPFRLSLRTKVVLAMATVAVLVVIAILATNYHLRRTQLLEEFQTFVRGAAALFLALAGVARLVEITRISTLRSRLGQGQKTSATRPTPVFQQSPGAR
ncbi:hypothetical protein BH20VER3_BH20VER3_20360 [soil metagenome]